MNEHDLDMWYDAVNTISKHRDGISEYDITREKSI